MDTDILSSAAGGMALAGLRFSGPNLCRAGQDLRRRPALAVSASLCYPWLSSIGRDGMELPSQVYSQQVIDVLRDLVRIDTTNPPGNETECARYLEKLLAPAGIETRIVESEPGRGNLIARLRGSGEGKPLMFLGHLDVVSADPSEWTVPPFAAEVRDGFVWGRGSTDMKNMVACCAVAMLALASLDRPLKRDVVLAATADEEQGGRKGVGWLAREMPTVFDVDCVINEGGGASIPVGDELFYTVQSAEKGVCRTIWTAHGKGGHGAYPSGKIATVKLSRALSTLGDGHLGARTIDTMGRALRTISSAISPKTAERVAKLLREGQVSKALKHSGFGDRDQKRYRALFSDTASVTSLRAGNPRNINVIPPIAQAFVDGRILPGQTSDGFVELLRACGGDDVEIELYKNQYSPGLESSSDHPIVDTISEVIKDRCDGARVIPWQCAGSTDAKHLVPRGVPVYGFVPAQPLPEGIETAGAHANDERAWVGNVVFALEVLYDVAHRYCQT